MSLDPSTPGDASSPATPTVPVAVRAAPDPVRGRILLGRYRVTRRIARGGMGSVYLARNVEDGERYAVKLLHEELMLDLRVRRRFLNESRAAQRIDHPAVVRVHEVGETRDGGICLVMELVDGPPLRRAMRRGPLEEKRAARIAASVASGLAAAHAEGVIHRDLKPENILLPRRPHPKTAAKIVDFGIARILDCPRITTTQHVMGTPQYISPEQAMGAPLDGRSDVYSLGVMLYEMLTGGLPFEDADPERLLRKHIQSDPTPISGGAAPRRVAPDLERLVMRCLEKSPRRRPADMAEVRAALEKL